MSQEPNVLIVDDDENLCEVLSLIFEEKGYKAESAQTGEEALAKLRQREFDIALIDIKLPDMEGTELLRALKEICPEIEGIIITGYASLESSVEALRQGAFDYVMKPFSMHEVLETVREALETRRSAEERRQKLVNEMKDKEFYRSLSVVDGLTGLYNHRHFHELLILEIGCAKKSSRPLALLMIDIDDFKKYQDAHGHLFGDKALKQIARTLRKSVRGTDIVARYGGEEFAIVLLETSKDDAIRVAERLRQTVEKTQQKEMPFGHGLTVSIGVACYPPDAEDKEQLITRADQALYQAKKAGRNRAQAYEKPLNDQALPNTSD